MQTYTKEDIFQLVKPDLTVAKLSMPSASFTNGLGQPVNALLAVEEFDKQLEQVLAAAKGDGDFPESFFVPDLWHIGKGRAKVVPGEEGQSLWNATAMGLMLGRTFYGRESSESNHNYPGERFSNPLDEPKYFVPQEEAPQ
jgi:hypothetical protein